MNLRKLMLNTGCLNLRQRKRSYINQFVCKYVGKYIVCFPLMVYNSIQAILKMLCLWLLSQKEYHVHLGFRLYFLRLCKFNTAYEPIIYFIACKNFFTVNYFFCTISPEMLEGCPCVSIMRFCHFQLNGTNRIDWDI